MTTRRMTAADYVEAGVPIPQHLLDLEEVAFDVRQYHSASNEHIRCETCGDEQGECGC